MNSQNMTLFMSRLYHVYNKIYINDYKLNPVRVVCVCLFVFKLYVHNKIKSGEFSREPVHGDCDKWIGRYDLNRHLIYSFF